MNSRLESHRVSADGVLLQQAPVAAAHEDSDERRWAAWLASVQARHLRTGARVRRVLLWAVVTILLTAAVLTSL